MVCPMVGQLLAVRHLQRMSRAGMKAVEIHMVVRQEVQLAFQQDLGLLPLVVRLSDLF